MKLLRRASFLYKLFILYTVIVILPVLAFIAIKYHIEKGDVISEELQLLNRASQNLSENIFDYILVNKKLIKLFATYSDKFNPALKNQDRQCSELGLWLKKQVESFPEISALYLLDKQGNCIASTEVSFVGKNYSFRNYFIKAISGSTYESDWSVGVTSRVSGLYISTPVLKDGNINGVIVLKLSTAPIEKLLAEENELVNANNAFIVNSDGIILAHSQPEYNYTSLDKIPPERLKSIYGSKQFAGIKHQNINVPKLSNYAKQVIRTNKPLVCEYYFNKNDKISVLTKVEEHNWCVGVTVPKNFIYRHLNEVLYTTLLFGATLIFLVFITVVIFYKVTFKRVFALTKIVSEFGVGNYSLRAKVNTEDEIGNLALSFNSMADTISKNTETLEKTVKSRTEKIKNFALKADKANKAKSEFLSNMSHELRTPLNGVIGFADLLNNTGINPQQKEYINNITMSANTLLSLINDILDYSKIEAGKLELELNETDVREVVKEAAGIISYSSDSKGIELLLNIQNDLPHLAILDSLRLKQILINLLNNAVKFTEKGEVELKVDFVKTDGKFGEFIFSVRDTGMGIPEEKIDKLFNAFTQVDSSTTRKFGGTGLGLAISNAIALKMGEGLKVTSIEGKGTTFSFKLEAEFIESDKYNIKNITDINNAVIVCENQSNSKILKNILNLFGIDSVDCAGGKEVLEIFGKMNVYDALIVDYRLSEINGIELLKKIHDQAKTAILLYDSCDTSDALEYSKESGIPALLKPVSGDEICQALLKPACRSDNSINTENTDQLVLSDCPVRILIAEDTHLNLVLIVKLLKKILPNAEIVEAANGAEALREAKKQEFDLILSDVQMPEMDGLEFARQLRKYESMSYGKHTSIVALTAAAFKAELKRCIDAGMDDFMTKPVSLNALKKKLRKFINFEDTGTKNMAVVSSKKHFDIEPIYELFDDDKEGLLDFFVEAKKHIDSDIGKLLYALNKDDSDKIKFFAHKLKGATQNMHFEILAEKVIQFEKNCNVNDASLKAMFNDILNEWKLVKNMLEVDKI